MKTSSLRSNEYLKIYTVFNVEQIDGLPDHYYAKAVPRLDPAARIDRADKFFAASKAPSGMAAIALIMRTKSIMFRCRRLNVS